MYWGCHRARDVQLLHEFASFDIEERTLYFNGDSVLSQFSLRMLSSKTARVEGGWADHLMGFKMSDCTQSKALI